MISSAHQPARTRARAPVRALLAALVVTLLAVAITMATGAPSAASTRFWHPVFVAESGTEAAEREAAGPERSPEGDRDPGVDGDDAVPVDGRRTHERSERRRAVERLGARRIRSTDRARPRGPPIG
jgi:hypothetical protein